MAYPELIRLLMDRTYRDDQLKRVNQKLLAGSALADGISREYTLNEIAIVTRAGPARLLGLARQRPSRRRRGRGRHGLRAGRRRVADVRDAAIRRQGRHARRRRRAAAPRACRTASARAAPLRRAGGARPARRSSTSTATVSFDNYPVGPCATRRARPAEHADVKIRGVLIEDTFAEAFAMRAARVVITARNEKWAREAALKFTGFATSVIACKCEAAIERNCRPSETPDGRPGVERAVLHDGHRRPRQAAHRAHRPDRAHLPDDQLLRRAAGFAGPRSRPAARCACSATSFRSAKSSAASATGACRSWKANSCCRKASACRRRASAAATS